MNDRVDSLHGRYQILKPVILIEYVEGLIKRITLSRQNAR